MLLRHLYYGHRCLLEFELSAGNNSDRTEQFLLSERSGLQRLRRRSGVLQRTLGQRPMSDADTKAADLRHRHTELLRARLRLDRQFVLPREPDDIHRRLLPGRTIANRPEQEPVPCPHSDQDTARPAMLRIGRSDRERQMLPASQRDDERRVLPRAGRSQ